MTISEHELGRLLQSQGSSASSAMLTVGASASGCPAGRAMYIDSVRSSSRSMSRSASVGIAG